jgi:hypothetical protein
MKLTVREHVKAPGLDRVKLSNQKGPLGSFDREDGERLAELWNVCQGASISQIQQGLMLTINSECQIMGHQPKGTYNV